MSCEAFVLEMLQRARFLAEGSGSFAFYALGLLTGIAQADGRAYPEMVDDAVACASMDDVNNLLRRLGRLPRWGAN